jgi:putative ABC transport system permease protein
MKWLRVLRARLAGVLLKQRFEREIDDELRFHLQMRMQDNVAGGLAPDEAERDAAKRLGNVALIKDACRDAGGGGSLEIFLQDLRFAVRSLRKEKAFTATAIIALVLGIGANTALFTVLSSVLLRPLPFAQPERLMSIAMRINTRAQDAITFSYPDFEDLRARNTAFEAIGAFRSDSYVVSRPGRTGFQSRGASITPEILPLLREHPTLGRGFVASDNEPGARSVIISERMWSEEFARAPDVLGERLLIDGQEYLVIGVMRAGFRFPIDNHPAEFWQTFAHGWDPYSAGTIPDNQHRDAHNVYALGRLRDGVTRGEAQVAMDAIARQLSKEYPATNRTMDSTAVVPLLDYVTREARSPLLMLIGAALCVLCVACANIANLLLARGMTRQKEISLRAALGAGRYRILRQLLTESLLLASAGATAGFAVAIFGTRMIVAMLPPDFPRAHDIVPDTRVLAFAGVLAIATTALFGFGPALRSARSPLAPLLKECSRSSNDTTRGRRARSFFVVAQMTLSFVLLIGACFLLRGLWQVQHADVGFDPNNLLTAKVSLPDERDAGAASHYAAFFAELHERIVKIGGVESATAIFPLPFTFRTMQADFETIGRPMAKVDWPRARASTVALDYFQTMRIPLLRGRDFTAQDDRNASYVAVINETLARTNFPCEDPIGKKIRPGLADSGRHVEREIVGIVGDVKSSGLSEPQRAEIYMPHAQCAVNEMTIVIRSKRPAQELTDDLRWAVTSLNPTVPVYDSRSMRDYIADLMAQPRLNSVLLSAFAIVAVALSAIGVYGIMAYSVVQRRHEIGIRLAFGAGRGAIFKLLLGQGARIASWSLLVGGAASLLALPLLKQIVPESVGNNAGIVSGVGILLAATVLLASWLPARRAASDEPLRALGER